MIYSLIAAYDDNKGIGYQQKLPWNFPEDLKHFKQLTLNKPIVMGRKTFDSLPGLLPKRKHIVLSRDLDYKNKIEQEYPQVSVIPSLESFFEYTKNNNEEEYCIIGGGIIWEMFLPYISEMHLTHIKGKFNADAYFPEWNQKDWKIISKEEFENFSFIDYVRV